MHYPLDCTIGFPNTYPLDSDLSGGKHYPTFEQLGPGLNNWDENSQARAKNNEVYFVLVRAYNREMITKNVGQKGFSEKENRNTKLPIYIISVQIQFSLHVLDYTLNA